MVYVLATYPECIYTLCCSPETLIKIRQSQKVLSSEQGQLVHRGISCLAATSYWKIMR